MVTEQNLRILKELLSGQYLTGVITRDKNAQLGVALNSSGKTVSAVLRKLEGMGIIVGYIPLLSEEGRRIIDALELMYGLKKGNHEALVDIMGQDKP
jgi:DNA-binding Lrp family transcriptional regulator